MTIYNPQSPSKICNQCDTPKSLDCFHKRSTTKDGLQYKCKLCRLEHNKLCRSKLTPEQKRDTDKLRYSKLTPEEKERKQEQAKLQYSKRTPEQKEQKRAREKLWLSGSPDRRIKANLRSRLSMAIRGNTKTASAVKDLGCSWDHFKAHMESKFTEGMTWDNYGEWHVDHIHPLARVDVSNAEELKKAVHYTNLQPLWALDNIRKSDIIQG